MDDTIETPRSIDVLLDCPTYQGMTDEEIASIIEYKTNMAARVAEINAATEQQAELMDMLREQQEKACAAAMQSLDNALKTQAIYRQVTGNE